GAEHDEIPRRDFQAADVVVEHRGGVQVVEREVEEALDLGGVQVEGQHPIAAGRRQQIGDQLGGDGNPADVLAVLAGVAVVGQHGRDARGTGPPEAVEHDQQLHQVLVDRRAGGLHDVDVPAAHVLLDADRDFAGGEVVQVDLAERVAQALGDLLGQGDVGPAAEDLEAVVV